VDLSLLSGEVALRLRYCTLHGPSHLQPHPSLSHTTYASLSSHVYAFRRPVSRHFVSVMNTNLREVIKITIFIFNSLLYETRNENVIILLSGQYEEIIICDTKREYQLALQVNKLIIAVQWLWILLRIQSDRFHLWSYALFFSVPPKGCWDRTLKHPFQCIIPFATMSSKTSFSVHPPICYNEQ
jgi:hypothetical protein